RAKSRSCWPTRCSARRSKRCRRPPRPAASATARFSSPTSKTRSASAPAKPARTRSDADPPTFQPGAATDRRVQQRTVNRGVLMKTANDVLKVLKDKDVKFVDYR